MQQAHAQARLQRGQPLAGGRRRQAELLGGTGEAAALDQQYEEGEIGEAIHEIELIREFKERMKVRRRNYIGGFHAYTAESMPLAPDPVPALPAGRGRAAVPFVPACAGLRRLRFHDLLLHDHSMPPHALSQAGRFAHGVRPRRGQRPAVRGSAHHERIHQSPGLRWPPARAWRGRGSRWRWWTTSFPPTPNRRGASPTRPRRCRRATSSATAHGTASRCSTATIRCRASST